MTDSTACPIQEALALYHGMRYWQQKPNQSVWNALLRLTAQLKAHQLPLIDVYTKMAELNIVPNEYTFSAVFHAATCQQLQNSPWLFEVRRNSLSIRSSGLCLAEFCNQLQSVLHQS